jgi:hypothetical protein
VRGGVASGAGLEPAWAGFRVLLGGRQPTRKWYGRRDLHPHAARFELARSALPSLPRAPPRPRTENPRIKSPLHVHLCLQRLERPAGIEPASSAWKAEALPLGQDRIVVPAGTEPASAAFQATANPSQLENHGREPGCRPRFLLLPKQAGCCLPRSRSTWQGSKPATSSSASLRAACATRWSGWADLNGRPPGPGPGALTKLRYNPHVDHRRLELRASCLQDRCSTR